MLGIDVEIKPAGRSITVKVEKAVEISPRYLVATEQTLSQRWLLPILDLTDLKKLRAPELTPADLPAWDTLRSTDDAASILEHGLRLSILESSTVKSGTYILPDRPR
jgi:hypothetical protein